MSALDGALSAEVDLEGNVATVDLFEDGECRLWTDGEGWRGFVCEDGVYYWRDTTRDDWTRKLRVGEEAVEETLRRHFAGEPLARPARARGGMSA